LKSYAVPKPSDQTDDALFDGFRVSNVKQMADSQKHDDLKSSTNLDFMQPIRTSDSIRREFISK
jgi:hypothetical protein